MINRACEESNLCNFMTLQDRIMLLIDEDPALNEIKDICKSPLQLARKLVDSCFAKDLNQGLLKYEHKLDAIKKRAAGITRAEHLASTYKIAAYSPYLFAFQQFCHSSYRARQGEVLEAVIYYSLKSANANPSKEKGERRRLVKEVFDIEENVGYDVDFFASKQSRILLGQIRSTDVTGGTTAKGSLVDLLRFILRHRRKDPVTHYIIVVWEPLERQQKSSLISKIWDSLRSEIGAEKEGAFKENIDEGWQIPETNILVRLIYGIEDFGKELDAFSQNSTANTKLLLLWDSIQNWDDLWLTYAVASLELENLVLNGHTNFQMLDKKLNDLGITISNDDLRNYKARSAELAKRILEEWTEDLPVTTASDILNYLRDLILMKMVHMKVSINGS